MAAVYLVRHGQASFGAQNYDALSELGFEQARVLGEALRPRVPRLDAVFMGTLRRQHETAGALLTALGATSPAPRVDGRFDEFDHEEVLVRHVPRWADRTVRVAELSAEPDPRRAFQDVFALAVARWASGAHDAEYRETWAAFRARCLEALDAAVAALGPARTVLAVTSGGVIAAVAQGLLGLPDAGAFRVNWTLANCGLTKVVVGKSGRHLSTLNEHAHFEGPRSDMLTYR